MTIGPKQEDLMEDVDHFLFDELSNEAILKIFEDPYSNKERYQKPKNYSSSFRDAIKAFLTQRGLDKTFLSEATALAWPHEGVEISIATAYRLLNEKKPFSPRPKTIESLFKLLGEDFLKDFKKDQASKVEDVEVPCDVCDTSKNVKRIYISQLNNKELLYFRAKRETDHEIYFNLCPKCFNGKRALFETKYSDLLNSLVSEYGIEVCCQLLEVNQSTLHRIAKEKIRIIRGDVAYRIHSYLIINTIKPEMAHQNAMRNKSISMKESESFFPKGCWTEASLIGAIQKGLEHYGRCLFISPIMKNAEPDSNETIAVFDSLKGKSISHNFIVDAEVDTFEMLARLDFKLFSNHQAMQDDTPTKSAAILVRAIYTPYSDTYRYEFVDNILNVNLKEFPAVNI